MAVQVFCLFLRTKESRNKKPVQPVRSSYLVQINKTSWENPAEHSAPDSMGTGRVITALFTICVYIWWAVNRVPWAVPFGNCWVAAERLVVVFTKISWSQADSKGKELGQSAPVEPFRVGTRLRGLVAFRGKHCWMRFVKHLRDS